MTKEEADFIGSMNMCDEISNEAYKKIMCHCEEQQPCEDCINKEEVDTLVDELARAISDERCYMSRGRSTATIMQDLLDLPSVTPQQTRWIPVSERLPEAGKIHDVLVTVRSKDPEMTAGHVQEAEYDARDPEGEWDFDIGTWSGREQLLVTAWMPLPEPYQSND